MRAKIPYFLGFIGALGFTLGIIGARNPEYSFTEILFGDSSSNKHCQTNGSNDFDEKTLSLLSSYITQETVNELADLVKTNVEGTPEAGGELRLDDRIRFYGAPNENIKIIEELERKNLEDLATLVYMKALLDSKFSGTNQCMPENADINWEYRIKKTREAIEDSETNFGDPITALDNLIENLRDTYTKGKITGNPTGVFLGDLHTHDNATEFSDVDFCISYSRTLFLVSHNYPKSSTFNLYATRNGEVVDLGEYDIN